MPPELRRGVCPRGGSRTTRHASVGGKFRSVTLARAAVLLNARRRHAHSSSGPVRVRVPPREAGGAHRPRQHSGLLESGRHRAPPMDPEFTTTVPFERHMVVIGRYDGTCGGMCIIWSRPSSRIYRIAIAASSGHCSRHRRDLRSPSSPHQRRQRAAPPPTESSVTRILPRVHRLPEPSSSGVKLASGPRRFPGSAAEATGQPVFWPLPPRRLPAAFRSACPGRRWLRNTEVENPTVVICG